jgi:tetratricopeptide (TPR) repeat protein
MAMLTRDRWLRVLGLALSICYASFIIWLYQRQPQTIAEVAGGLSASVGAYHIDQQAFDDGLRLFRNDQFEAARSAFERADPARQDARTQFYIAYTYYRAGWGRLYHDDQLYQQGMERVDKAIALAPGGRLIVDDPNLHLRTADELRAELAAGLQTDASDLNPMRLFRERK